MWRNAGLLRLGATTTLLLGRLTTNAWPRADAFRGRAGESVALTPSGRRAFFRAYEQRMDTLVTHPRFGYRVNYRRLLDVQTRLLGKVLTDELPEYAVFVTR